LQESTREPAFTNVAVTVQRQTTLLTALRVEPPVAVVLPISVTSPGPGTETGTRTVTPEPEDVAAIRRVAIEAAGDACTTITPLGSDAALVPNRFVAVTVIRYSVPAFKLVIVQRVELVAMHVPPPGAAVAV
jgi:hypothetical protein